MYKNIFFAVAFVMIATVIGVQNTYAQEVPKVEVGGQYSLIRGGGDTDNGFGGLFVYNFTDTLSFDSGLTFFPEGVNVTQVMFGGKAGKRSEKFGLFGKVRPGFLRAAGSSAFAMDLGGVVEVYSSSKLGLRFDIGDTIIRSGGVSTNNLQVGAGVMFRF